MGFNDHMPDEEFADELEQLALDGYLQKGTAAFGIAQQVLHRGYSSLTESQQHIYDTQVGPLIKQHFRKNPTDFDTV